MRQIYIASSWKNAKAVNLLVGNFREIGCCVYSFAEMFEGQHHFNWSDVLDANREDGITCLKTDDSIKAFKCDKFFLDIADCCVLLNPCGRDAHLEAGYIKGRGNLLYIIGDFPKGEFSNMYHLADGLFRYEELDDLLEILRV